MIRPKPPKVFDITSDGYHEHNRYFNKAEKIFDVIEKGLELIYDGPDNDLWMASRMSFVSIVRALEEDE